MPLFAIAGAALAAIVLAGTSAKKKAASSPRKKASSPKKKDLTSVVISSSKKMSKQPYLVIGWALKASGWEVFSVVKSREQTNDAYSRNFQLAVTDTLEFRPHGFIAVVLRRLAHDQNQAALNSQDGYPRKLFIRVIDDESTHESRMEAMNVIKEVCCQILVMARTFCVRRARGFVRVSRHKKCPSHMLLVLSSSTTVHGTS